MVLKEVVVIAAVALRATIFTAKPEWKLGTIVRNLGCVHNYTLVAWFWVQKKGIDRIED